MPVAEIMISDIVENGVVLQETPWRQSNHITTILHRANAHGIINPPTLLVTRRIHEGTPMSATIRLGLLRVHIKGMTKDFSGMFNGCHQYLLKEVVAIYHELRRLRY